MKDTSDVSVKQATEELLQTHIFKNITKRTNQQFSKKLAFWLIRYILIISSMNQSLNINLEQILVNLHGERLKKIVSLTNKSFETEKEKNDCDNQNHYIW